MACLYGSSVKPGINPDSEIMLDRAKWEALNGTAQSWFDVFLGALTPRVVKVSDLCAANVSDPALPTLATLADAVRGNPAAIADVVGFAISKMEYYESTLVCVCNAAPGTCSFSEVGAHADDHSITESFVEYARFPTIAGATFRTDVNNQGSATLYYKLKLFHGATFDTHITSGTPVLAGAESQINWGTGAGGHDWSFWSDISLEVGGNTGFTGVVDWDLVQEWTGPCVDTPVPPTEAPEQPVDLVLPDGWDCSTVEDLCLRLSQMDQRLSWLYSLLTLIQRQALPYAFINGAPSTGLTGDGTVSVSGITGLLVTLTSVPSVWGWTNDVPRRSIPKVGAIAFSTAAGNDDERQVHYDAQLVLQPPPSTTSVRYSFRPGVTATVTPLLREP
jgi:hypothetical protein